ncbi:MAG: hypothetical protein Dasosvirus3_37 [Dasosvirus sp.]|uniref:F-box domain-containing protein n=1 Tax=Dasosvirus sp. TaxID=2487764 RepID=A0A3G4ZRE8_9VIRU|nr:MAG: hypothetical protein Dasosvirus3_37 [Dasosvirus sp.]
MSQQIQKNRKKRNRRKKPIEKKISPINAQIWILISTFLSIRECFGKLLFVSKRFDWVVHDKNSHFGKKIFISIQNLSSLPRRLISMLEILTVKKPMHLLRIENNIRSERIIKELYQKNDSIMIYKNICNRDFERLEKISFTTLEFSELKNLDQERILKFCQQNTMLYLILTDFELKFNDSEFIDRVCLEYPHLMVVYYKQYIYHLPFKPSQYWARRFQEQRVFFTPYLFSDKIYF